MSVIEREAQDDEREARIRQNVLGLVEMDDERPGERAMAKYEIHVTLEASSIQAAINSVVYPCGEELQGITDIWANEVSE